MDDSFFMPGIPPDKIEEVRAALLRPEGTLEFTYPSDTLCDPNAGTGVLFKVITGKILFLLQRDETLNLHFIHSAPGTGTRIASLDMSPLCPARKFFIALVWSPTDIRLHVGDADRLGQLLSSTGVPSPRQFRVGNDGRLYILGDHGVEVMGARVNIGGRIVLQATAREAWQETVKAIEILLASDAEAREATLFGVIRTNLVLVMLVTGFEAYCKERFLELEQEGITPDVDSLLKAFLSSEERSKGIPAIIRQKAHETGMTPLQVLIEQGRVNFQNWERCKDAYNKGYGIKFGELGVKGHLLDQLQRFIEYRHAIVHGSPLTGILNFDRVPPEEPVFAKNDLAQNALQTFDQFIQSLHEATLRLRSG